MALRRRRNPVDSGRWTVDSGKAVDSGLPLPAFPCLLPTVYCLLGLAWAASAADWPQWRGPNRDGLCTETGLLKEWPDGGPPLLWTANGLGTGFSTVSIVGTTLFTMGDLAKAEAKLQYVIAIDLGTKKTIWTAKVGPPHGDGPRCAPTVDEGLVYALGTSGDLVCVEAASGKEVWHKHLQKDLGGGGNPGWKFSESPLVDGEKLICTPGGAQSLLAALNKKTGEVIWKSTVPASARRGNIHAEYSSPVVAEVGGVRQYLTLLYSAGLVSVAAKDGQFLWNYPRIANGTANIPTALVDGDEVFTSTAYQRGAALLKLASTADGGTKATEVYFLDAKTFQNHHGGCVKVGDYLYGGSGHGQGAPTCIEWKTGKIVWQEKQPGGGSAAVLYADGNLIFRYQEKQVVLVEATPEGYRQKGFFVTPPRPGAGGNAWPHPVICDGKLYLRHGDVLYCYDVKKH